MAEIRKSLGDRAHGSILSCNVRQLHEAISRRAGPVSGTLGPGPLLLKKQMDKEKKLAVMTEETYLHPVDIGDPYKEMNCSDCH